MYNYIKKLVNYISHLSEHFFKVQLNWVLANVKMSFQL